MWVIFLRAGAVLPFIAILGESGPLFEVRWDVKRFEGLFKRVTPCHVGAAQRPGVRHPSGQEFARYASHGHARNVAGPAKDAVAVKSSQGLLFSEARKPCAEAAGHGRRGWCARVWSPPPPGLSKESGER